MRTLSHISYTAPKMVVLGNFSDVTRCLWWGECRDFLGCGLAPICI
ncbi:lasso RiPP family leader peptide-containing protein [Actinomyces israelii]